MKRTALIVDDDLQFEVSFPAMLDILDWKCEVVDGPEKALGRINAQHFDLLITDFHMPQGNGYHFISCLRRDGITLPAIMMSGDAQALNIEPIDLDLLNIRSVLLKPFGVCDLRIALEAAGF